MARDNILDPMYFLARPQMISSSSQDDNTQIKDEIFKEIHKQGIVMNPEEHKKKQLLDNLHEDDDEEEEEDEEFPDDGLDEEQSSCGCCGDYFDEEYLTPDPNYGNICDDCDSEIEDEEDEEISHKNKVKKSPPVSKKEDSMKTLAVVSSKGRAASKRAISGVSIKRMVQISRKLIEKKTGKLPKFFDTPVGERLLANIVPIMIHMAATGPFEEYKLASKVAEISEDAIDYEFTKLFGDVLEEFTEEIPAFFEAIVALRDEKSSNKG